MDSSILRPRAQPSNSFSRRRFRGDRHIARVCSARARGVLCVRRGPQNRRSDDHSGLGGDAQGRRQRALLRPRSCSLPGCDDRERRLDRHRRRAREHRAADPRRARRPVRPRRYGGVERARDRDRDHARRRDRHSRRLRHRRPERRRRQRPAHGWSRCRQSVRGAETTRRTQTTISRTRRSTAAPASTRPTTTPESIPSPSRPRTGFRPRRLPASAGAASEVAAQPLEAAADARVDAQRARLQDETADQLGVDLSGRVDPPP
jgi:hypothetical protein